MLLDTREKILSQRVAKCCHFLFIYDNVGKSSFGNLASDSRGEVSRNTDDVHCSFFNNSNHLFAILEDLTHRHYFLQTRKWLKTQMNKLFKLQDTTVGIGEKFIGFVALEIEINHQSGMSDR
jgi:hypothetical protein